MAQQRIDFGQFPDDANADAIRTAFIKVDENFTDLYTNGISGITSVNAANGILVRRAGSNVYVEANVYQVQFASNANSFVYQIDAGPISNRAIYTQGVTAVSINPAPTMALGNIRMSGNFFVASNNIPAISINPLNNTAIFTGDGSGITGVVARPSATGSPGQLQVQEVDANGNPIITGTDVITVTGNTVSINGSSPQPIALQGDTGNINSPAGSLNVAQVVATGNINGNNLNLTSNAIIACAVSIGNTLVANGVITANSPTVSTSTGTGGLVVAGGAGIAGNVNIGGNINVGGAANLSGVLRVTDPTPATAPGTGALQVTGGASIGGDLYSGNVIVSGGISTTADAAIAGNATIGGNANITGNQTVSGVITAQSNVNIGGNAAVTGNLTVSAPSNATFNGNVIVGGNLYAPNSVAYPKQVIFAGAPLGSVNKLSGSNNFIFDQGGNFLALTGADYTGANTAAFRVYGGGEVYGELFVQGNIRLGGNGNITGNTTSENLSVVGNLQVGGNIEAKGGNRQLQYNNQGNIAGAVGVNYDSANLTLTVTDRFISTNDANLAGNVLFTGRLISNVLQEINAGANIANGAGNVLNVEGTSNLSGVFVNDLVANSGLVFTRNNLGTGRLQNSSNLTYDGANLNLIGSMGISNSFIANSVFANILYGGNANIDIAGNIQTSANIAAGRNISASGNILATGNIGANGNLGIAGTGFFGGNLTANTNLIVTANATVNGNANVVGNSRVGGNIVGLGNLNISGTTTVGGDINGSNNAQINGNLTVIGRGQFNGNLNTSTNLSASGTLSVTGTSTLVGDVTGSNNGRFRSLGINTAASGTAGEIRATDNITAYFSDDRLKTRLGLIENAIDKIASLTTFYYEPNDTAVELGYKRNRDVGLSAQEVLHILPEAVTDAPIGEPYLTIRHDRLNPLIIAALKEIISEIREIKTRLG